jgi:hypothetical protein
LYELLPLRVPIRNTAPKQVDEDIRERFGEGESECGEREQDGRSDDPGTTTVLGKGRVGDGTDQRLSDESRDCARSR